MNRLNSISVTQYTHQNYCNNKLIITPTPTPFKNPQQIPAPIMIQQPTHPQPSHTQSQARNDSCQSQFDSTINELSVEESKFCSVFIEFWEVFQVRVTSFEVMSSANLFGTSRFIVYNIRVLTDHVSYNIQKRYSQFLNLYRNISRYYPPKTAFPEKTRFRSKVCPALSECRRKAFDDLLNQIISLRNSNKSVVSELINFLNVKNYYSSVDLDENVFYDESLTDYMKERSYLYSHFLKHQIIKMNSMPNQSLRYLQKIQNILNNSGRAILKLDDLKAVLIGVNQVNGLIQAALSNENEIVSLTFLKFVKKLLNPQTCCFAQAFKRILQTAPTRIFILHHEQLLQNQQLSNIYFQLIDIYCKLKQPEGTQKSNQIMMQFISPWVIQKFKKWKQSQDNLQTFKRRKTKLEMTRFSSIQHHQPERAQTKIEDDSKSQDFNQQIQHNQQIFEELVQKLKSGELQTHNKYIQSFSSNNSYFKVSQDRRQIYILIVSNKGFSQVSEAVQKWEHNKMIQSYNPAQKLTNISKMFIKFQGKSQKLFQFQQLVIKNQDDNKIQIYLSPPKSLKNNNSFFYYGKVTKNAQKTVFESIYYFHNKRIKKLFQQSNKKSSIMWDSLHQKFLEPQEQKHSKNSPAKTSESIQIY